MDLIEWLKFEKRIGELKRNELLKAKQLVDQRLADTADSAQSTVEEYVPYRDGHLQLEYRTNPKTGTQRGPYWYFRYHEGGKQRTLYLGSGDLGEAKRRADEKRTS